MLRANAAKLEWDPGKKQWHVVIQVGAEVIKRWCPDTGHEEAEDTLRSLAVQTAKDEGYDLDPAGVSIAR